ncbi:peptidylprolyl isomerase [Bacteroidota bacterium]
MATLETIRKRAGILMMGAIGLAMLGFILGDFNLRPSTKVAEIDGKSFQVDEYLDAQQVLRNFYKLNYGDNLDPQIEKQIEDETWSRLVRKTIMGKSYKQLGIDVSTDELKTMVAGDQAMGFGNTASGYSEPHPIVRQMFTNPETGEFNRYIMMNYFNSLERDEYAQERERWVFIENEIIEERLNQKYVTMLSKGLRPSSLEVKDHFMENGKRVDFNFVSKNIASISDEEISFTDAELKAYYKENMESYKQDASRTIQYVVFEVVASDNDDINSKLWTQQTKAEFERTERDRVIAYVNSVSDEPIDTRYYSIDEINPILKDSLLNEADDHIFGPYYENESYKLSRIMDTQMRPDSVRVRHILLGYAVIGDMQRAQDIADSLKTVIENGGDFNLIALQYSADESNRNIGGDLGWFREGMMETPFNDACFENKTGELVMATTRYGVHIIKIEAQSKPVNKIQVASIVHNVIPSNETDQDFYSRAVKFRGASTDLEKFEAQAIELGLDPRVVPNITKDQRTIPGLETPVGIIGWAYSAEEGDVSNDIFDIEDKYIVVALTEVNEAGYAEFEDVRNEIELAVKKQKKAEVLMADLKGKLANASDLNSIATSENLTVSDASQVMFANAYVSGVGMEPYIVGASMYLPEEQISGPFIGENSVILLDVTHREEAIESADMSSSADRLIYSIQSRSNFEAYNAMMEVANVQDNRLKIFYGR